MKSEKMIKTMLEQYEFNLEMDKIHYPQETERIHHTEQWIKCLRWVLDAEQIKIVFERSMQ